MAHLGKEPVHLTDRELGQVVLYGLLNLAFGVALGVWIGAVLL
jgi:hypothetical protein